MAQIQQSPSTSGATVTVACKLPHGLICRVFYEIYVDEQILGGGIRKVKEYKETGEIFTLLGNAAPEGVSPIAQISNGFALTYGISKDIWDRWISQNVKHSAVVNGLIFAHENRQKTIDEGKEKHAVKSGLERLDPFNLPQEFKKKIRTSDEQKSHIAA